MKTWLKCKRFSSNKEIIAATNEYFEGYDKNYFLEGIIEGIIEQPSYIVTAVQRT